MMSITPRGNVSILGSKITGLSYNTTYILSSTKNHCTSSSIINISDSELDCDGVPNGSDPADDDPCNTTQTPMPKVMLNSNGTEATITNYDSSNHYSPITTPFYQCSRGVISGLSTSTIYILTVEKNNCVVFSTINYKEDGIPDGIDSDDNDPCNPTQTPTPKLISKADCDLGAATSSIVNYDSSYSYDITLSLGVIITNQGVIEGLSYNTTYVLSLTTINISDLELDCDVVPNGSDSADDDLCNPTQTSIHTIGVISGDDKVNNLEK